MEQITIQGRQVTVYPSDDKGAPVVYSNEYEECGEALLKACRELGVPGFHLVTVSGLDWNRDLSPWHCGPVVMRDEEFDGGAGGYLKLLEDEIMPCAEGILDITPAGRILEGYSMAGLFAVYASLNSDRFDDISCVSGSVWFPGFRDYFENSAFGKKPQKIYFSLGEKETKTRNPVLQTTAAVMQELSGICTGRGVRSVFELNPGNHFKDNVLRMARGIKWIMSEP
ncbi:MAG: alpha/beta hydrolase [Lachnospiraceae bacterium]|nr:alpha/beta hydrolase [Lachnospiraceae bacterium]